jgi:GntR family transcriptional regulator, rspAB operon transcriptional repressor
MALDTVAKPMLPPCQYTGLGLIRLDLPDIVDGTSASSGRLSAQVYGRIKSRILAHLFEPGAILQELTLASELGVSRTPIREALKLLTDEGLVIRRGRFYQTRQLSTVDVRQIYEVREALETASVCLCAARAGDSALADLTTMIAGQREALQTADGARFTRLDSAFHLQIAMLADNSVLLRQLAGLHDKVRLVRLKPSDFVLRAVDEHRRIAEALQRRDAAVAVEEMRSHIRSVVRLYADSLSA